MDLPKIRPQLVTTEIGDELLVFNPATEKGHCLSAVGGAVFLACREESPRAVLEERVRALGAVEPGQAVEEALRHLLEEGLLDASTPAPGFDRRRFLAAAGALALPIVASVVAPRAATALSCKDCLTVSLVPQNCGDCGKLCPATPCASSPDRCCFEYRYNSASAPGALCNPEEATGIYSCRLIPSTNIFLSSCFDARAATVAAGAPNGTLYYCCCCSGAPAFFTCC